jgi:bifunctional enzyme CysN/CysC
LICLAAFLAPQEEVRQKAAEVVGRQKFLVVHLDAPLEICRARDQEGLYAAADAGELPNFPGVSAVYEVPSSPDLALNTAELDVDECVGRVVALLKSKQVIA